MPIMRVGFYVGEISPAQVNRIHHHLRCIARNLGHSWVGPSDQRGSRVTFFFDGQCSATELRTSLIQFAKEDLGIPIDFQVDVRNEHHADTTGSRAKRPGLPGRLVGSFALLIKKAS